ncbi:sialidase-1 [Balneicella halophila]|uniref:exo-alpha-sialidase n=1 Tax=Balneicella halophila TaxID=1537566 RepID=A0A7L4UNF7_BALHA|nr:sialidase family protein [Balneicella halophila]PVX50005.1 sialidase-1 [Balneicella halophila]
MHYYKFISIILILFTFSCKKDKEEPVVIETKTYDVEVPLSHGLKNSLEFVKVHSDVTPILKAKEDNIVLSWNFQVKDHRMSIYLKGLSFTLKGTENLEDFKGFSLEYIDDKDSISTFGELTKVTADSILTFSDKVKLSKGRNSFRLKCSLKDNANINNHLEITPLSMTISGKKYKLDLGSLQRKFGIALLQHGQGGIDTYRIPGLITTRKGTLIAVYDIRHNSSKDLQGDIDVGMSRSTDGGQTWQPTDVVIDMGEYGRKPEKLNGVGDPSILYDEKNHTLWVAALWAHGMNEKKMVWTGSRPGMSPRRTGQLVLVKSTNDGKTWSEPYNITSQVKNPDWQLLMQAPGRGVTVGDSVLVFPVQFKEKLDKPSIDGETYTPFASIIYSKDRGRTWQIGSGAKANTMESQAIVLNDGNLMLNMRDIHNKGNDSKTNGRAIAFTDDFGATWTNHSTSNSALVEPSCQASLIKDEFLVDGNLRSIVLFSNPASKAKRENMSIKVSLDDAESWLPKHTTLIDSGEGRGYSSLTKVDDEHVGILYEGSGADLVFQIYHIKELIRN